MKASETNQASSRASLCDSCINELLHPVMERGKKSIGHFCMVREHLHPMVVNHCDDYRPMPAKKGGKQ